MRQRDLKPTEGRLRYENNATWDIVASRRQGEGGEGQIKQNQWSGVVQKIMVSGNSWRKQKNSLCVYLHGVLTDRANMQCQHHFHLALFSKQQKGA